MSKDWAKIESAGEAFKGSPFAFKQRCFTFLYILCNDKDLKRAATYLAPNCVLVHEDGAPVDGPENFISAWGKNLRAMPEYHKDMKDMVVEMDQTQNGSACVWVYSQISGMKPGVVRDSIDMMRFTAEGLFLYSKDVQRDTKQSS